MLQKAAASTHARTHTPSHVQISIDACIQRAAASAATSATVAATAAAAAAWCIPVKAHRSNLGCKRNSVEKPSPPPPFEPLLNPVQLTKEVVKMTTTVKTIRKKVITDRIG